jgi:DNA-binding LacI/PurR family transcriptional regulator
MSSGTGSGTRRSNRVTIADVAALAGVSRGAVSQVFNGTGSISGATAQRIRDAAAKLNWTPSATAVALRRSRSTTVGLVLADSTSEIEISGSSSALITGLESVLSSHGYGLLLYVFGHSIDEEGATYRKLAHARRVDGVVLTNSRVADPRFELLRSLELPAVLVGRPWTDDPVPHLDAESPGAGVAESVEHLLALGHTRIAYIGGPEDLVLPLERRAALERSLRERRLSPMATIATRYSAHEAARHTAELLDLATPPTAVMYGSDGMAIAGMKVAKEKGFRVPDDLSIVGYDGLSIGQWVEPELTTVQRNGRERGRAAAAALLRLLGEQLDGEYALSAPQLVVRGSTGPAR